MGHTEERKTPKHIEDARSAVQPVVMAWVPVSERMPEPGRVVLAAYRNALGCARYVQSSVPDNSWHEARAFGYVGYSSRGSGVYDASGNGEEYPEGSPRCPEW